MVTTETQRRRRKLVILANGVLAKLWFDLVPARTQRRRRRVNFYWRRLLFDFGKCSARAVMIWHVFSAVRLRIFYVKLDLDIGRGFD